MNIYEEFIRDYRIVIALYIVGFICFFLAGRLTERRLLHAHNRVPRVLRAIYRRKLELDDNISFKKTYYRDSLTLSGTFVLRTPFITQNLYAEPAFILLCGFMYIQASRELGVVMLLFGIVTLIFWLYDLVRITIPALTRKKYWAY